MQTILTTSLGCMSQIFFIIHNTKTTFEKPTRALLFQDIPRKVNFLGSAVFQHKKYNQADFYLDLGICIVNTFIANKKYFVNLFRNLPIKFSFLFMANVILFSVSRVRYFFGGSSKCFMSDGDICI